MCYHVCVVGSSVGFQSPYAKKNVTGRIGHSVTFAWKFFGGVVDTVTWGLANEGGTVIVQELASLDGRGVLLFPESVLVTYKGRVNGTRSDDSSSGQASFTLFNITKNDKRYYGCLVKFQNPNNGEISDFVQLVVVGMYLSSCDLLVFTSVERERKKNSQEIINVPKLPFWDKTGHIKSVSFRFESEILTK